LLAKKLSGFDRRMPAKTIGFVFLSSVFASFIGREKEFFGLMFQTRRLKRTG
jgi:hypothetical protein